MNREIVIVLFLFFLSLVGCGAGIEHEAYIEQLSVGRADAHLLVSSEGTYLIDTGDTDGAVTDRLHELGITKIDTIIITHGHKDHYGGLEALRNEFNIGKVYFTLPTEQMCLEAPVMCDWDYLNSLNGLMIAREGEIIVDDPGLSIKVISTATTGTTINSGGTILSVNLEGKEFLFMADATLSLTKHVMNMVGPHDVYKVPHHGLGDFGGIELPESIGAYVYLISTDSDTWARSDLARKYFKNAYVSFRDGVVRLSVEKGNLNIIEVGHGR